MFRVYNSLGPGLLESAYEAALDYELRMEGLNSRRQVGLPLVYGDTQLEVGYRIDIMVNNLVIVEIKSVEALCDVHYKQVLTYLKLSSLKLGTR